MKAWYYHTFLLIILIPLFLAPVESTAQVINDDEAIELYPSFRHRSVINTVIVSYYKNDDFYLPMGELFRLLKINYQPYINGQIILKGKYLEEQTPYEINLTTFTASFGKKEFTLTQDDFLIGDLDYYFKPEIFKTLFDLDFAIDFNNLALTLESIRTLPVVSELLREQKRTRARYNASAEKNYDIRYSRNRSLLNGGVLDYNISNAYSENTNLFTYNGNVGFEAFGGDVEGNMNGSYSQDFSSFNTNGLRWRTVFRENPWISSVMIGQTRSDGLVGDPYTGIRISNDPVEPRRMFDEFRIEGNTLPESEVELYLNNSLVDFQETNELGNYDFLVPLTYGISRYDVRIFGPTGQVQELSKSIQIPFTFTPPGEINYQLNAGRSDVRQIGSMENDYLANGNIAVGITDWLSTNAGIEYYESLATPTFKGGFSARLLSKYLVQAEAASDAFIRTSANVVYPNAASLGLTYTNFTGGFGIYNLSNDQSQLLANFFFPVTISGTPVNFRLNSFTRVRESLDNTRLKLETSIRKNRLNISFAYSDSYVGELKILEPTNLSRIQNSYTYSVSRASTLPQFLRGSFIRAQFSYLPKLNQFEGVEFLFSRNINQNGRIQFVYARNFFSNFNSIGLNLVLDFNKTRSSTTFRSLRNTNTVTQNFRGSIGFDSQNSQFLLTNRQQVGRSASAIRLFVDNNANSVYDEGDEIMPDNAVRIDRAGASFYTAGDITYFTQLQPYFKYNMEIIKSNIRNPMLVPVFDKFAIISDPNQFKSIDIPFYISGVMEGRVERKFPGTEATDGLGGVKILINKLDSDYSQEVRSFSEGSYYAYELPPGKYEARIEKNQLDILKVVSDPEKIEFEIRPLPEGDFIEGLNFLLLPVEEQRSQEQEIITTEPEPSPSVGSASVVRRNNAISINYNIEVDSLSIDGCLYGLQLGTYSSLTKATELAKQHQNYNPSIVFNTSRDLYALRSKATSSFSESAILARSSTTNVFPDVAVINKCYSSDVPVSNTIRSGYEHHFIQFGAFFKEYQSDQLVNSLDERFSIQAMTMLDDRDNMFKVRVGPYESRADALKKRLELVGKYPSLDLYLTKQVATNIINADFEFVLQLGEFRTTEDAALYAIRIDNSFNIRSKVIIDEQEDITLITEQVFTDWNEFLGLKRRIEADSTFIRPVIQLIQKKQ